LLYLSSLPAAVTIRKPPHKRTIKAIRANIPNTQLIHHLITLTKASSCPQSVAPASAAPTTATASALPESCALIYGFGGFNTGHAADAVCKRHILLTIVNPIPYINFFRMFIMLPRVKYYYYISVSADSAPVADIFINQKIILTINHDIPITIRPIAACFKIVHHLLYLSSLPAAVTISNPP
jgi:hypothetical protein